jgi:hypothetical protein
VTNDYELEQLRILAAFHPFALKEVRYVYEKCGKSFDMTAKALELGCALNNLSEGIKQAQPAPAERREELVEKALEWFKGLDPKSSPDIYYGQILAARLASRPHPAPAEQGEGLIRKANINRLAREIVKTVINGLEVYIDNEGLPMAALDDGALEKKVAVLLASRPQPEAADDARELARSIGDEIIGKCISVHISSAVYLPLIDKAAAEIERYAQARLASARKQGEAELLRVNTALAACSETAAERYRMWKEAERKGEEMRAALTDAVKVIKFYAVPPPSSASGHPQRPCDMQAYELLRRIAALATPAEGKEKV